MDPFRLGSCVTLILMNSCVLTHSQAHASSRYTVRCGKERLEFVALEERGYVIKPVPKTGGIHALASVSVADVERTGEVRGLDGFGMLIVENEGPAGRNEDTLRALRAGGTVAYAAPLFSCNGETVAIMPEIVVRMIPGTDMQQLQALCEKANCRLKKRMEFTEQEYLLEVLGPDAEAVFVALEVLNHTPGVEWAAPNTALQPKLGDRVMPDGAVADQRLRVASGGQDANIPGVFPTDPYFPKQWHLCNTGQTGGTPGADIRAPEAWEITTGDPNIVIAVLDCGVDTKHPDLINNLVAGYDFIENDPFPDPAPVWAGINAHGTMCAGLIAAQGNNAMGVTGVTWNCTVMPIRVGNVHADGSYSFTTSADSATAIRWAAAHGADIVSNSWFAYASTQPIMYSAIVDITKAGGIGRSGRGCVFVSAGHNLNTSVYYPARYSEVIAVGATDDTDRRWAYSNYGPALDLMAPGGPYPPGSAGVTIWTTDIAGNAGGPGDYAEFGGTSASTPIVAGVAALILSVEPNLTNDEVRHFLERSAKDLGDPGRDDYYGWGRVDAKAALDMVLAKRADLNGDWQVDEQDLTLLNAAVEAKDLSADIAPAKKRDGVVDEKDRELLRQYLGTEIPEFGLLAHWKLDESQGETAFSIERIPAALHGGPIWQPAGGRVKGALLLDGVDDYVETPFLLNPADGPFSVFAWVKGGAPGQVVLSQAQANGTNWLLAGTAAGALMTEFPGTGRGAKPLASAAVITDGA